MSTIVAEIEARIRSLSLDDKTELIRALIAELDGPGAPGWKKRKDATKKLSKERCSPSRASASLRTFAHA